MLKKDQSKNIAYVYSKLIENDIDSRWTTTDDLLESIQWISDPELFVESEILYSYHKNKNMGCPVPHTDGTFCFVKNILEAVEDILELYKETNNLHKTGKYILQYYLVLYQTGSIVELLNP